MKFSFTREQDDLRRTVREFLAQHAGRDALQAISHEGYAFDTATWSRMARQLGVQGLAVPERFGGSEVGELETSIVLEEMGHVLYAGPFLSTLLATTVLRAADETVQEELLPAVAEGDAIWTVALVDEGHTWSSPGRKTVADAGASGHVLTGRMVYVTDPAAASSFVVHAQTAEGPAWFVVEADAPGLTVTVSEGLDLTREIGHVDLRDVPARLVVPPVCAAAVHADLLDAAAVGLAAEMVGGAASCLEQAVSWSAERHQFGRPIGSFQAIKHRCADVLVEIETARVLTHYAAYALSESTHDASLVASMAKQAAADAFHQAAASNIQIHGGIGFTWEHPAHLYLRRAKASAAFFDDSTHHRERIATLTSI
ncbi:acyl-CoA dehydrogenase family protein [Aeromicrobium sp. CTD01-1L150]|uniref:acyl-CoA dehydrogenase family protein n=1 Tax=Aeromicrobium sp. CTD01-1L150 TaxID=3341830 RepID=UPI0035C0463D